MTIVNRPAIAAALAAGLFTASPALAQDTTATAFDAAFASDQAVPATGADDSRLIAEAMFPPSDRRQAFFGEAIAGIQAQMRFNAVRGVADAGLRTVLEDYIAAIPERLAPITEQHEAAMLNAVLLGSAVQLIAIPCFGALSDRLGRRPVYLGGALFLLLFAFPFFWLMETRQPAAVLLAVVVGLIGHSAMYGPQAAFFSELFGTRVRYSGASLGYQLASPLAGGLAPLIATALLDWSGGRSWPVAAYLVVMALITLVSVWKVEETHRKGL